jgi:basic membrane lipoprotein Med (substrate-binding protein (PBP1-ABC) superfamily)
VKKLRNSFAALALAGIVLAACGGNSGSSDESSESDGVLSVVAAYSSVIEEPWDGVIHEALQEMADAGEITYKYIDGIGYASGAFERAVRQIAEEDKPAIIMGDSFGNEEAARKVALDYPDIAFVMGSGGGPAEPNFSVFDNWIHEPAYVSGILAGSLTKTNIIGIVGGIPVPEVNRIVNAFIAGAQSVNPKVEATQQQQKKRHSHKFQQVLTSCSLSVLVLSKQQQKKACSHLVTRWIKRASHHSRL